MEKRKRQCVGEKQKLVWTRIHVHNRHASATTISSIVEFDDELRDRCREGSSSCVRDTRVWQRHFVDV